MTRLLRACLLALCFSTPAYAVDTYSIIAQSLGVSRYGLIADMPSTPQGSVIPGRKIWDNVNGGFASMAFGVNTVQWPQTKPVTATNFGTEWGMAKRHYERWPQTNAFWVKTAVGGTGFMNPLEWSPWHTNNLLSLHLDHLKQATVDKGRLLTCAVFVIGQDDRNYPDKAAIKDAAREIFRQIRSVTASPDAPMVWALLAYKADGTAIPDTTAFRTMQYELAAEPGQNLIIVDFDALPLQPGDPVHINSAGTYASGVIALDACHPATSARKKRWKN
jgi:hypothetical protein